MRRYGLLSMERMDKGKELMQVGLGHEKADRALVNGTLLNVYTGELLKDWAVLTKGAWIAYVGDAPENGIGPETEVLDAAGKILVPGFIDGHAHLADGLYSPIEFLRYAMVGGTTTIVTETIEPFPIVGYEGVVDFLDALKDQPIKIFATAPAMASTSRASNGMPKETLKRFLSRDEVIGLGESYWQSVLQEPDIFLPSFRETLLSGRKLEGHSAGAKGRSLTAYVAAGISSCHEPITADEALERLRLGLYVMIREGSIRRDLAALSEIKDKVVDLRRLILVTDGVGPEDLLEKGYMEYVVQKAVELGFDPVDAIRMATINPAEYFQLDGIVGGLAPGRHADVLILKDLQHLKPEIVISKGKIIAENGKLLRPPREYTFKPESLTSVSLPGEYAPSDFTITVDKAAPHVTVRVIDQISELVTREFLTSAPVTDGEIKADPDRDILKVAAIDRRFAPGKTSVGLIRGFHLKEGAVALSSAWDTSDIIVVGENEGDMAAAVNRIHEMQGGAVLCSGGHVLVEIPLPIFGLLSELPLPALAERVGMLTRTMKDRGFPFNDPLRTLSTLTGAAIPFLRICEDGLVDIKSGETVPLVLD